MANYENADLMWAAMVTRCAGGRELDSREGGCREVIGWSGTLDNPMTSLVTLPMRKMSAIYAGAEVLWYLSRTGKIKMIQHYAPSYPKWANEDDDGDLEMYGAVGARLIHEQWDDRGNLEEEFQLENAVELLQRHPNTRQCVIALWNPSDLSHAIDGDKNNLPCYISMQFILRNNKLNLIVYMRSNDVWLGAPYDIYAFICIQKLIADCVGAKVGTYTHQVGSLHIYDKHSRAASEATMPLMVAAANSLRVESAARLEHHWQREADNFHQMQTRVQWACNMEEMARISEVDKTAVLKVAEMSESQLGKGLIRDSLLLCLHHRDDFDCREFLTSPRLKHLIDQKEARQC